LHETKSTVVVTPEQQHMVQQRLKYYSFC